MLEGRRVVAAHGAHEGADDDDRIDGDGKERPRDGREIGGERARAAEAGRGRPASPLPVTVV